MTTRNRTSSTLQMILVIAGSAIAVGSLAAGATPLAALGLMLIVAGLIIAVSRWWQHRHPTS